MKKSLGACFIGLCMMITSYAQSGKVYDNLSMRSEILKMERNYAVYLPPDYEPLNVVIRCCICCMGQLIIIQDGCNLEK